MINKTQIESVLKINGVSPSEPDERIRSILLSARYSDDEVDTAIMILRENVKTNKTRVDGLHKIFRTEEALRPEEISQLLGIDVEISDRVAPQAKGRDMSDFQYATVWLLSVLLGVGGIILYMYLHKIGIFYSPVHLSL
ncbi:MAG: hypothetical protein LR008_00080 [Candidatus Pacebacteria bacterium]|nr:hypothetical protein [Candidatus Paceibacterota bacterium]